MGEQFCGSYIEHLSKIKFDQRELWQFYAMFASTA